MDSAEVFVKIIFILILLFGQEIYASNTDSINLSASVSPACEIFFDAESIASNLDITNSQTDLAIGRVRVNHNTDNILYGVVMNLDFIDHLTHSTASSNLFNFSEAKGNSHGAAAPHATLPFGSNNYPWYDSAGIDIDVYLSYIGIAALSLIQGTYNANWYASCSIEPRG